MDARVEELAVGLQQRVEILKILFRGARILIFDEPTAVLTPQESNELFRTFRALTAHGKGVIFITHKLDEVLATADRITVIRQGKIVRTMDRAGVTKPMIAELMVGKPVLMEVDRPSIAAGRTVLEVRDLKVRSARGLPAVDGISFSVRAGEIYGIAGVEGNGQSELVHAIAEGVDIESGDILLEGVGAHPGACGRRREKGIAHIPEDRLKYGLLLPFSIATNLTLGRHDKPPFATRLQLVNTRAVRESARNDHRAVRHPHAVGEHAGERTVRRQPAEGGGCPGAFRRAASPGGLPAHARRGHRGHGVHPSPDHEGAVRGKGGPAHLRGPGRAARAVRPDRRHLQGQDHQGVHRTTRRCVKKWVSQ